MMWSVPYGTNVAIMYPYLSQNSGVTVELSNIDFSIDTMEEIFISVSK